MPWFRFLFTLLLTVGLIIVMDRPLTIKEQTLPPLGRFFSPQHGYWQQAEPIAISSFSREMAISEVRDSLHIYIDKDMIPRIFAKNDRDAIFGQGYVSAYLRLFQMDISTRATIGRLSEIMGNRTLEFDLDQRRKGLHEAANRIADKWMNDPEIAPYLQAYLDGINTRIKELTPGGYPLEYKLIDAIPEPWDAVRLASFYLAMSETLARTAHDLPLSNARLIIGHEAFDLLYPDRNPKDSPVYPYHYVDSIKVEATTDSILQESGLSKALWGYDHFQEASTPGVGSNNWALAPSKTASGHAILANDPHLALTLPSIWLEMQISTPGNTAYGVAFTSMPGIAIGFNQDIAWGFTNGGQDVLDWYEIHWTDAGKTTYLLDGKEVKAKLREEIILVKGMPEPVRDTLRMTHWGPVPQLKDGKPNPNLAMHWLPSQDLDPKMANIFMGVQNALNLETWRTQIQSFDAPMQNAIYADKRGNIGLKLMGKMPLRSQGSGRFVYDGQLSENAWIGFVPGHEVPESINPGRGFVSSCNQHSTYPSFPYAYTGIFEDWRGRYANDQLAKMEGATIQDMIALQNDVTSLRAKEGKDVFLKLLNRSKLNEKEASHAVLIDQWGGNYEPNLEAPVLFELWIDAIDTIAWDELYVYKDSLPVEIPEKWRLINLLESYPQLSWWDIQATPIKEEATEVVTIAFKRAIARHESLKQEAKQTWGTFKNTTIRHIARIDAFSATDLNLGGHKSALNAISETNGPSWRFIVELGPEINAYGIYPGGQSGNPGSPFYRNLIKAWQNGQYRTLRPYSTPENAQSQAVQSFTFLKSTSND